MVESEGEPGGKDGRDGEDGWGWERKGVHFLTSSASPAASVASINENEKSGCQKFISQRNMPRLIPRLLFYIDPSIFTFFNVYRTYLSTSLLLYVPINNTRTLKQENIDKI